jgi:hypothetical protein
MGGSIYTKRQSLDVSPAEPDFTAEKMVQAQVADIQGMAQQQKDYEAKQLQAQKDFELKEQQKNIDFVNNINKKEADQILDNAFTLYPDNKKEYDKYVNENVSKVINRITDENEKVKLLAELSITNSKYDAKITKNTIDKQNKVYNGIIKDTVLMSIDSSTVGLSSIFEIGDKNLSLDMKQQQEKAFIDASIDLRKAYDKKDLKDDNGNFIFSQSERKTIADAYENRAKYALLKYTSDNIDSNRQGVVNTYNYLKDNRNEVMKKYGLDIKEYDKTLRDMDKIIRQESTYDIIKTEGMFKTQIDIYDIKSGQAKDGVLDEDIMNTILKLEDSYSNKLVEKSFYADNIEKLKSAYINYKKPKKKMFSKKEATNVKDVIKNTVNSVCDALGETYSDDSVRFDLEMLIRNNLKDTDINSAKFESLDKANSVIDVIMPKLYKKVYPDANVFSDEELKQKNVQDFIKGAYKERRSVDRTRAIVGLATNNKIEEKLSGFNTRRN